MPSSRRSSKQAAPKASSPKMARASSEMSSLLGGATWECEACTYKNPKEYLQCDVCNAMIPSQMLSSPASRSSVRFVASSPFINRRLTRSSLSSLNNSLSSPPFSPSSSEVSPSPPRCRPRRVRRTARVEEEEDKENESPPPASPPKRRKLRARRGRAAEEKVDLDVEKVAVSNPPAVPKPVRRSSRRGKSGRELEPSVEQVEIVVSKAKSTRTSRKRLAPKIALAAAETGEDSESEEPLSKAAVKKATPKKASKRKATPAKKAVAKKAKPKKKAVKKNKNQPGEPSPEDEELVITALETDPAFAREYTLLFPETPLKGYRASIGCGAFGLVLTCELKSTKEKFAVKVGVSGKGRLALRSESRIMAMLKKGGAALCQKIAYLELGKSDYNVLVINLLGKTLQSYMRINCSDTSITFSAFSAIATSSLKCLEALHKCKVIHRDIKPANFLLSGADFSLSGKQPVVLVDFGHSCSHDQMAKDRAENLAQMKSFVGTFTYSSANAQACADFQSYKDDLEALGYMAIVCLGCGIKHMSLLHLSIDSLARFMFWKMLKGRLPWEGEGPSGLRAKRSLDGCPAKVKELVRIARKLEYGQMPNYSKLIKSFERMG